MKTKRLEVIIMCLLLIGVTSCNKSTAKDSSEETSEETSTNSSESSYIDELEEAVNLLNNTKVDVSTTWGAYRLVEALYDDYTFTDYGDVYEYLMTLKDTHTYGSLLAYYPYPEIIYGKTVFCDGYAYTYEEVKGKETPGEYFAEDYDGVTTFMYYLSSIEGDIKSEINIINDIYKGQNNYYTYKESQVNNNEIKIVLTYEYEYFNEDYYQTYSRVGTQTLTFKIDTDNILYYLYIEESEDEINSNGRVEATYSHCLLFERKEATDISLPSFFNKDDEFYYGYYTESISFNDVNDAIKAIEDINLEAPSWDAYLLNHMSTCNYQVGTREMKVDENGYLLPGEYDISNDYERHMKDETYTYYLQKDENGNTYGRCNYYLSIVNDMYDQSSSENTQIRYAYSNGYRYARYTDQSYTDWDMDNPEVCDQGESTLYDDLLNEVLETVNEAIKIFSNSENYVGASWSATITEGKCQTGNYNSKSISYEIEKENGDEVQLALTYDRFNVLDSLFYYSITYGDNYYRREQISLSWLDPYDAGLPTGFEGSWY